MLGRTYPKLNAQPAIREAFFKALNGKVSCEVYDNVPKDTPPPYVKIGDCRWEPDVNEDKDYYTDNFFIQIEARTYYGGSTLCSKFLAEVVEVVSHAVIDGTFTFDVNFKIGEFTLIGGEQATAEDEAEEHGFVQYGLSIVQVIPT